MRVLMCMCKYMHVLLLFVTYLFKYQGRHAYIYGDRYLTF